MPRPPSRGLLRRRAAYTPSGGIGSMSPDQRASLSALRRQEALAADEPVVPGALRPSEYWNRLKAAQREKMRRPV